MATENARTLNRDSLHRFIVRVISSKQIHVLKRCRNVVGLLKNNSTIYCLSDSCYSDFYCQRISHMITSERGYIMFNCSIS